MPSQHSSLLFVVFLSVNCSATSTLLAPSAQQKFIDVHSCPAANVTYNNSGCSAGGHYATFNNTKEPAGCCTVCANDPRCVAWTYHSTNDEGTTMKKYRDGVGDSFIVSSDAGNCYVTDKPVVKQGVSGATCGCKTADCQPPTATCQPVFRPTKSGRVPLPKGIDAPPHIVSFLIDDLGFADTSIRGNSGECDNCDWRQMLSHTYYRVCCRPWSSVLTVFFLFAFCGVSAVVCIL